MSRPTRRPAATQAARPAPPERIAVTSVRLSVPVTVDGVPRDWVSAERHGVRLWLTTIAGVAGVEIQDREGRRWFAFGGGTVELPSDGAAR